MNRILIIAFLLLAISYTATASAPLPDTVAVHQDIDTVAAMDTETVSVPVTKGEEPGYQRNFFVELFGPSMSVIGVGFDSRFRPSSPFGFRVGLAYTNGSYNEHPTDCLDFKGINIPLEVNAIFGKRKSKFEIGIGIVPAILRREQWKYKYSYTYDGDVVYGTLTDTSHTKGTHLNVTGLLNVGYRYQRQSGFFMRIGLTFMLGDISFSPINTLILMPNVAFGYTIR